MAKSLTELTQVQILNNLQAQMVMELKTRQIEDFSPGTVVPGIFYGGTKYFSLSDDIKRCGSSNFHLKTIQEVR